MNFVKLSNELATLQDISPVELYVYSYLSMWQRVGYRLIRTNVSVLNNYVSIVKNRVDNRERIRGALRHLEEKGFISCKGDDVCMEIKLEHDWADSFTLVPSMLWDKVKSPNEWAVVCYILRWGAFRSKISYLEFSVALKCAYKTAVSLIQKMEERGVISVDHGKFMNINKSIRQEMNKYKVEGGLCGESAAHEMVRMKGYALMGKDQRILDDKEMDDVVKIYYENDREKKIMTKDVKKYSMEQKKKFVEENRGVKYRMDEGR